MPKSQWTYSVCSHSAKKMILCEKSISLVCLAFEKLSSTKEYWCACSWCVFISVCDCSAVLSCETRPTILACLSFTPINRWWIMVPYLVRARGIYTGIQIHVHGISGVSFCHVILFSTCCSGWLLVYIYICVYILIPNFQGCWNIVSLIMFCLLC